MAILSTRQSNLFVTGLLRSETVRRDIPGLVRGNFILGDYSQAERFFDAFGIGKEFTIGPYGAPKPVTVNLDILPPENISDQNQRQAVLDEIYSLVGNKDTEIVGPATALLGNLPNGNIEINLRMFYPEFLMVTETSYSEPNINKVNLDVKYNK